MQTTFSSKDKNSGGLILFLVISESHVTPRNIGLRSRDLKSLGYGTNALSYDREHFSNTDLFVSRLRRQK